ncbi:hypothetical protein HQ393_10035 [Chitinibacter bivalviorum]|uniref:Uncharacterized protein n=1 Tax=Chitinibacter bivalviorum TaxID=2739434 RepID=A0A7H9BIS2_9NEIS|nr:hypothetical protein [Chitinibacter bivalviorum]QLG88553.1 hypothetical protein HQ393_10035 [Chitinibacter bivalviorum]
MNEASALHSTINPKAIHVIKVCDFFDGNETTNKTLVEQVKFFEIFNKSGAKIAMNNARAVWNGQSGTRSQSSIAGKWGFKYEMEGAKGFACVTSVVRVGKNAPLFEEGVSKPLAAGLCFMAEAPQDRIDTYIAEIKKNVDADTYVMWVPKEGGKRIAWKNGVTMELPLFPAPRIELEAAKKAAEEAKKTADASK